MTKRGWTLLAVVAAALVLAVVLLTGGEETKTQRRASDPAAWIQRDFPVVAHVDTAELVELVERFPGADFVYEQLPVRGLRRQLGGRAAIGWDPARDAWVTAVVLADPDAFGATPGTVRDDDVLIAASTPELARAAVAVHDAGRGARATARSVPFVAARLSAEAVGALLPGVGLGAANATVVLRDDGLHVRLSAAVADAGLLPVALGPKPPQPAGDGPITVALRHPKPALRALLRDERIKQFDGVRTALRRYLRADLDELVLDRLTGTATVTVNDRFTTVRAPLTDGDGLRRALDRAAKVPGVVLDLAGVGQYDLAEADGRFVFTRDELPLFALGVEGDVLVVSTNPRVDPAGVAARKPRTVATTGALHATVSRDELVRRILERFALPPIAAIGLEPLGALTATAHAERSRVTATATLPVARP